MEIEYTSYIVVNGRNMDGGSYDNPDYFECVAWFASDDDAREWIQSNLECYNGVLYLVETSNHFYASKPYDRLKIEVGYGFIDTPLEELEIFECK